MHGRSRVFMVGIGSAPNTFLMTRAAEIGRGTFTHIGSAAQVDERMRALFDRLESPVVTNLSAVFSAAPADVTPIILPDVYRGEPVALTAKVGTATGTLEIKGMIGDQPWVVTLPVANAAEGSGLSKLWARRKITDAEVARTLRTMTPDEADKRILALALEHKLVTRLTSLVAVDKTPSRPAGVPLTRAEVPLNLPAGWDFDKVFGPGRPVPADRARLPVEQRADADEERRVQVAAAYGSVVHAKAVRPSPAMAPVPSGGGQAQAATRLPQTATDAEIRMVIGLILCVASLMLLVLYRRRRVQVPLRMR
jgi:Ca-activated chloride channel family protein